jgi:hypothetical protein
VTTGTDTLASPIGGLAEALIAKFSSGVDPMVWMGNAARARGCSHPVRLRGSSTTVNSSTGEIVGRFESADLPDSVLYLPCGTRRGVVCPACAEVYRQDTYQLLKAGLVGGKGVPDEVTSHPAVFATPTAPTFGPVHTRRTSRDGRVLPCRPRRDKPHCEHHPDDILPPPPGLGISELREAIQSAAASTGFRTDDHPATGAECRDALAVDSGEPGGIG